MDDREIVSTIAAGDPAGLAEAYDEYAGSLYGYCHWMLGDPGDAADAVQDTFVVAASRLGDLSDARKLRPWLYAVARNECQLRLDGTEPGLDDGGDLDDPYPGPAGRPDHAELRELVRTVLGGLKPAEREVIELDLRHDLHGADLAAVLGVPRNQAHELATGARGQLERGLGALLAARNGRRACPELDMLLDGWDGELTPADRKRIDRHAGQCGVCADRIEGALRPAMQHGMAPLSGPPLELREEVLQLCTSSSPGALSYRRDVTRRAGPFRENGFPEPVRPPRRRVLALSGMTAAVAAVVIAITATGIVAAIALSGHPPRPVAGAARPGQSSRSPGTATSGTTADSGGASGGPPSGAQPTASVTAVASTAPPAAAPSSATPVKSKPSPSHRATSAAPTPTPTRPRFTFSPSATPTVSPSAPSTGTTPPG